VNGKGYVPVLQLDNGQILIERYKLQEWLNFITSELHKPMGSMFKPAQTADTTTRSRPRPPPFARWFAVVLFSSSVLDCCMTAAASSLLTPGQHRDGCPKT
jgi:glutathione S-transferase